MSEEAMSYKKLIGEMEYAISDIEGAIELEENSFKEGDISKTFLVDTRHKLIAIGADIREMSQSEYLAFVDARLDEDAIEAEE